MTEITGGLLDLDWETVEWYKMPMHHHAPRGYVDEPADVVDMWIGDMPDVQSRTIPEGEEADIIPVDGKGDRAILWPWEEFDQHPDSNGWKNRDPEALGVVAVPGAEINYGPHVSQLFSLIVNDDVTQDGTTVSEVVDDIMEADESLDHPQRLVIPAHPNRHHDPEDWETDYKPIFESHSLDEGVAGLEVLNKNSSPSRGGISQTMPDIELWDNLLEHFMPDRPIYAFSAGDPGTDDEGWNIGERFNTRFMWVALDPADFDPSDQTASRQAIVGALLDGQFVAVERDWIFDDYDNPPQEATINSFSANENTITIDASGYDKIRWVSRGHSVGHGNSIEVTSLDEPYVRAQIQTSDTLVLTQPFGIEDAPEGTRGDFGEATLGDSGAS